MTNISFCWIHHEAEPIPPDCFVVCFECKHVWTARDLVKAHNAVLARLARPGTHWTPLLVSEADEVFCCPECVHDF